MAMLITAASRGTIVEARTDTVAASVSIRRGCSTFLGGLQKKKFAQKLRPPLTDKRFKGFEEKQFIWNSL